MQNWFHTFFQTSLDANDQPRLELQIRRRDTTLYQGEIGPSKTFSIGSSQRNPFCIQTPGLPIEEFQLVHFHEKGPLVQFTSNMRGILYQNKRSIPLDSLKHTLSIHPTLYGYRFLFPANSTLTLFLDQIHICFRWVRHSKEDHPFIRIPLSLREYWPSMSYRSQIPLPIAQPVYLDNKSFSEEIGYSREYSIDLSSQEHLYH